MAAHKGFTPTEKQKDVRFTKGHSGNPGGKPLWLKESKAKLGTHLEEALETVLDMMRNGPPKERLKAAEFIIDHAIGKAAQKVVTEDEDGNTKAITGIMVTFAKPDSAVPGEA